MRQKNGQRFLTNGLLRTRDIPDRIARPQLEGRLLGGADAAHVTVLVGPAGSGKTDLVRTSLTDTNAIYFRVGNERRTFARFVHGFARAIAPIAPGALASFPRAWERALQSRTPSTVLAHWLCDHLDGIDRPLAIDDLHDAAADLSIASFIAKLAELRPKASLTIAVQSVGALPIALWMATRQMQRPVNERDLRFSRSEVARTADQFGVTLDATRVDRLVAATDGLPITVAYALTRLRGDSGMAIDALMPASFKAIADAIFARRTDRERDFLWSAALLPTIDDEALQLSGWDDPQAIRSTMGSDATFLWDHDAENGLAFHDRFRDYLLEGFAARDPALSSAIARRAMHSLMCLGRHAAALELATQQQLSGAIAELLDAHGFNILESGEIGVISEALDAFADSELVLGASALALRGYIEARLGRLDTAEAWFRLGLAKASDESSRVAIAMYYARELSVQRRQDACDVLEAFVGSTSLPQPVLIDVRSSFAQALTAANRLDEARSHTDEALALLDQASPPALRARVFARAAYVALESGNPALARERALVAAPLAISQALYDVAASAYSVLYNVAYDIEDDAVASLEHLRCLHELGVKSGTLRLDLYVMLGMYELYAEAGNETALTELDQRLNTVDKHHAGAEIIEGLTPGRALRAAWAGNFDAARRLLESTAERQRTPTRTALCWAQIGLYAAAAGHSDRVECALGKAKNALPRDGIRTTQTSLTLLILALAAFANNNIEVAASWMRAADDSAIDGAPRLCALRSAVAAMIAGFDDAGRFVRDVPGTLAALRRVSFGGMANLIEALPYRSGNIDAGGTIGSALAQTTLSARFAAALAARDAFPLSAWLDTLSGSTFANIAVIERFDRWAVEPGTVDAGGQKDLRRVRRQLAAYRRPAPLIIRAADDLDALLDALFEQLDENSPLMAEHSRAVSAWCSRLARTIGLSESQIAFVTRCGLIHDIGKMRTPAEILNAPRQLTAAEWAIMRDHTVEGGRILGTLPALLPFVPIVRGHHERLDGQGYPDGLRASAIPLAARIVSVADSFNAMIGRRPYRPPMVPTAALDELERHRHTQFDPEIVEAMIRIVLGRFSEPAVGTGIDFVDRSRSAQPKQP